MFCEEKRPRSSAAPLISENARVSVYLERTRNGFGWEEGKIGGFLTSMSGDIFKAIREHTILRGCTQHEPNDDEAFLQGVERAKQADDLAHHLFGVRTLVLTGAMPDSSGIFLSIGIADGHEVRTMARQGGAVLLVGTPALCSYYQKALGRFDVSSTVEPEGAALRGLKRIAGGVKW